MVTTGSPTRRASASAPGVGVRPSSSSAALSSSRSAPASAAARASAAEATATSSRMRFLMVDRISQRPGGTTMDLEMRGQVAAVVGAAQGIGEAIARAFAAEGAWVALIDRDPRVHETASSMAGLPIVADVTDYAAVEAAARRVKSALRHVDHVVFAVGIGSGKFGFPFWNLSPSDWPRVFAVNVIGAANVAPAFAPHLVGAGWGTMLFLSSVAGQIGSQTAPPYSASKAALINFAQCAAK